MTTIVLWSVVIALFAAGFAGIVLPVVPGAPLLWAGVVVYAWATQFTQVSMTTVILTGVVTLVAMLVDFLSGVLGAKAYGASWYGVCGAVGGGLVGMVVLNVFGLMIGTVVGAFVGEYLRWRTLAPAVRASVGTIVGLIVNSIAQLFFAMMIVAMFIVAVVR